MTDVPTPTSEPTPAPVDVTTTGQLVIRTAVVGDGGNDAYLLTARATGAQLLIDAADSAPALLAMVAQGSGAEGAEGTDPGRLEAVLTTHRHADHHGALAEVVAATGARTLAGADDADALPVPTDVRLAHGDAVRIGGDSSAVSLEVVHLRGHTPGSVAVVHRDDDGSVHVFTGDSLFPGGVGRTTSPADFTSLIDDVEQRLFAVLPDEAVVHPGHGDPTTIGAERPHLGQWRARGW